MPYRLGVDVGGTFTDLILVDEKSGSIHTAKVPSTPADSSIGVMNGVARVCDNAGVDPSRNLTGYARHHGRHQYCAHGIRR